MSRQLYLTCMIDLPDDLFEGAAVTQLAKPAWGTFLATLKEDSSLKFDAKAEIVETRAARKKIAAVPKKKPMTPVETVE